MLRRGSARLGLAQRVRGREAADGDESDNVEWGMQLLACLHADPSVNLSHWLGDGHCRCQERQAGDSENDDHFGVHFDDNAGVTRVQCRRSCEALCAFAGVEMGRTIEVNCYG